MELTILSASAKSRAAYDLINKFLDHKAYSREYQMVHAALSEFYQRDKGAKSADLEIVSGILMPTIQNPKHKERFKSYIIDVVGADASVANVSEFVLSAKRVELAGKVAVSMANKDGNENKLIKEYMDLQAMASLDDATNADVTIIDSSNIHDLMDQYLSNEGGFQLYPKVLNDRLKGRLAKGHHVIVFGVPEMGKTAFNITAAAGFCMQKRKGIYFLNEDKNEDVYFRIVSCLSGMSFDEVMVDRKKAIALAMERGLDCLTLIGMAPGSVAMITSFVEKLDPEWVIVDQMINLNEKGDGLSQILGKASKGLRILYKQADILGVSVCQGGDSAEGKAVLEMGDVYMSNTEVPAAADLLLGLGANRDQLARNERTISMPKNKVSGDHNPFTARIIPQLSRWTGMS